jgi:hypothetical protein
MADFLTASADSYHRRRFVEKAIRLHGPAYVVGKARERKDGTVPITICRGHWP